MTYFICLLFNACFIFLTNRIIVYLTLSYYIIRNILIFLESFCIIKNPLENLNNNKKINSTKI